MVGCGDAAANEACDELQDYESRIIETDADDENANQMLAETYSDMSDLAERTDGELGDALSELQPLLEQLTALSGEDEQAATQAQETVSELSEEQIENIDEAAELVNETCDLSVLL